MVIHNDLYVVQLRENCDVGISEIELQFNWSQQLQKQSKTQDLKTSSL